MITEVISHLIQSLGLTDFATNLSSTFADQPVDVAPADQLAIQAQLADINAAAGEDILSLQFLEDGSVHISQTAAFDPETDQQAFDDLTHALINAGFDKITAVNAPVYQEALPEFSLPEGGLPDDLVDPGYSVVTE